MSTPSLKRKRKDHVPRVVLAREDDTWTRLGYQHLTEASNQLHPLVGDVRRLHRGGLFEDHGWSSRFGKGELFRSRDLEHVESTLLAHGWALEVAAGMVLTTGTYSVRDVVLMYVDERGGPPWTVHVVRYLARSYHTFQAQGNDEVDRLFLRYRPVEVLVQTYRPPETPARLVIWTGSLAEYYRALGIPAPSPTASLPTMVMDTITHQNLQLHEDHRLMRHVDHTKTTLGRELLEARLRAPFTAAEDIQRVHGAVVGHTRCTVAATQQWLERCPCRKLMGHLQRMGRVQRTDTQGLLARASRLRFVRKQVLRLTHAEYTTTYPPLPPPHEALALGLTEGEAAKKKGLRERILAGMEHAHEVTWRKGSWDLQVARGVPLPSRGGVAFVETSATKHFRRFQCPESQAAAIAEMELLQAKRKLAGVRLQRTERRWAQWPWRKLLEEVAELDVIASLAACAHRHGWVSPQWGDNVHLEGMGLPGHVKNDVTLPMVLTGANGSGKTTLMRSVGYVVLLAHIGGHVPAASAVLPRFEALGMRFGTKDSLEANESSFYREMKHFKSLMEMKQPALILVDELGSTTSAREGEAVAHAAVTWLHRDVPFFMFATHYFRCAGGTAPTYRFPYPITYLLEEGVADAAHALRQFRDVFRDVLPEEVHAE